MTIVCFPDATPRKGLVALHIEHGPVSVEVELTVTQAEDLRGTLDRKIAEAKQLHKEAIEKRK